MHNNLAFSLYMLIVGGIWFIAYILTVIFKAHFVLVLLTEIGTWVFFWETVNSFFLERRHLKHERLKKFRLMQSKIVLSEFKLRSFDSQSKKLPSVKKHQLKGNKKTNV